MLISQEGLLYKMKFIISITDRNRRKIQ